MKKIVLVMIFLMCYAVGFCQIKGNYAIKNVETELLLRVKDANAKNGTPLVAYTPQNWKCMTWDFQSQGDNSYQLRNLFTNKTFQQTTMDDNLLDEQPLEKGAEKQLYVFEKAQNGFYHIRQKSSGLYLEVSGKEVNSRIALAKKSTSKRQLWEIYPQSPTM